MAKKSKIIKEEQSKSSVDDKCSLFAISKQNLDPSLTTLFSSSVSKQLFFVKIFVEINVLVWAGANC